MSPNSSRARSSLVASPDCANVGRVVAGEDEDEFLEEAFEDLGMGDVSRSV